MVSHRAYRHLIALLISVKPDWKLKWKWWFSSFLPERPLEEDHDRGFDERVERMIGLELIRMATFLLDWHWSVNWT
jgi:hypothetical protein